jgi:glucarate dehydratase
MSPHISSTKIARVTSTAVSVPMRDAYSFSVGKVAGTTRIIIEVETSDGIVGVGETFQEWTQQIVDKVLAPRLIGENPFNLERLSSKCLPTNANQSLPYIDAYYLLAFSGIEMALWDIIGKVCETPSAMLMGGIYRTEIPFCDYIFVSASSSDPNTYVESVAKYAKWLVDTYHSPLIEFKVGVLEPKHDVELVGAVREALGNDTALRIDANCAWTESTALRTVREIERYDVANIEEPCNGLAADARIRRVIKTPVSVHSTRVRDVAEHGLDSAVVNPLQLGGFRRLKQQIAVAEDSGIDVWLHSRGELGFATAAYMQFLASTRYVLLPSQSLMRPTEDMLTKEGMPRFENGFVQLSDKPGLGVTLDHSKLEKYHALFEEKGEYNNLSERGLSPPFY